MGIVGGCQPPPPLPLPDRQSTLHHLPRAVRQCPSWGPCHPPQHFRPEGEEGWGPHGRIAGGGTRSVVRCWEPFPRSVPRTGHRAPGRAPGRGRVLARCRSVLRPLRWAPALSAGLPDRRGPAVRSGILSVDPFRGSSGSGPVPTPRAAGSVSRRWAAWDPPPWVRTAAAGYHRVVG